MRFLLLLLCGLLSHTMLWAADSGAVLYDRHCAACHGVKGKGGTGVPLALDAFQHQVSDQFLMATIRLGRPGRVMPAFSHLKDDEIQRIVEYVRTFTQVKIPAHGTRKITGNRKHGARLFQQHCAACHGDQGQGSKGTGVTFSRPRDLPILAPALNNSGFLASASDEMIKRTLMEGREGTPMASFSKRGLSEQDINDIVSYVRSFEQKDNSAQAGQDEPLTIEYESEDDVATVVENIKQAAQGKNFRLIRVQHMDYGFVPEAQESKQEVIVYFCNFKMLNQALAIDSRVGLFLPCRITVYKHKDKVKVVSINPKRLSYLFNNNELDRLCDEMYKTYNSIMEEATL